MTGDRVGDRLQDHGLAGLRRGHDQASLALADRRDEVDDPGRQHARVGLQAEPVLRVQRGQLLELRAAAAGFGRHAVDRVEADQRVELLAALAVLGLADRTGDVVTLAQTVLADLGERDVHVVRAGQVAGGPDERVVVEDVQDARDGDQDVVLGDLRLVGREVVAATTATAVAVAAPAAAAAALEVVVVLRSRLRRWPCWPPPCPGRPGRLLALRRPAGWSSPLPRAVALAVTALAALAAVTALAAASWRSRRPSAPSCADDGGGGLGLGVRLGVAP